MTYLVGAVSTYIIHGTLIATNRPLKGLSPLATSGAGSSVDLRLDMLTLEALEERWPLLCLPNRDVDEIASPRIRGFIAAPSDGGIVVYHHDASCYRLVAVFSDDGRHLDIGWREAGNPGLDGLDRILTTYVIGNLIALARRLAGQIVLHGNAVRVGERSIAWVGGKGAGKSTLSAAFVDAGHAVITDDQLVLREDLQGYRPAHGVPRIRLWPHSLAAMTHATLTAFNQPFGASVKGWLEFQVPQEGGSSTPPPLAALYVLEPRAESLTGLRITNLSPSERLLRLLHHRLARVSLPLTPNRHEAEFRALTRLAGRVQVRSLQLPDRLESLTSVVKRLVSETAATPGR